ncbi:MAG: glycosyltransferase family 4 protein [Solirubrobacteraceae bacterium]|nr:glycosyltransferase family 4 protein [Solirubrobacteraceae bacterium]
MTTVAHGGAEYANVDLLDGLAARGWDTTLITDLPDLVTGTRVNVREADLGPKLSKRSLGQVATGFVPWTVRLRRALAEEAARAPIDVTLLHFKKEQLMTPFLPRSITGRVLWAEWGPLPLPMRRPGARHLYATAARMTDHILAVSRETADSLIEVGVPEGRVSVLPPIVSSGIAFDPEARARVRARWGVTDDTFVVGCVSRLSGGKRVDVIIDALDHLDGDVRLVIAGEGDNAAELRARAAHLGDRVLFLPGVRGQVSQILSAFDAQVFAPQEQEGLPRSLMLGMLMGLPVLATGPTGAAGLLDPSAVASPAHDPRAVAALLARHRADPALRRREGDALRTIAQRRFDPARTTEQAERVLLGQNGARPRG